LNVSAGSCAACPPSPAAEAMEARQIPRPLERSMSLSVRRSMDTQTKREFWLLALGTIIVEMPVALAAFAVFSH
jgi:hypothetical protein